jgi:hypothetical protein
MTPVPGKLADAWKAAKLKFQTTTGIKKPADTLAFFRLSSGIEPSLKKVDAVTGKAHESKANYAKYKTALASFSSSSYKAYETKLKAELKTAKSNKNIPSGTTKDKYVRGLNELLNDLSDILGAANKHSALSQTASSLLDATEGAVERALGFIGQVKRNPQPKTFNDGILKAARDINQQIGNVNKLKTAGMDIGRDQPSELFERLRPWASGQRQVADNATSEAVLAELDAFRQAVEAAARWAA